DVGATPVGDPRSPVRFPSSWFEGTWSLPREVAIGERRGCDAAPIDPTRDEDRLRLLSYVWPDQRARFERLAGALEVAGRVAVVVDTADACDWLGPALSAPVHGDAARVAERLQVLGDCLPGHRPPVGELTRGRRAPVQELAHDRATRAVGERSEDAVERVVSTAHRCRALVPRARRRSATWELRS